MRSEKGWTLDAATTPFTPTMGESDSEGRNMNVSNRVRDRRTWILVIAVVAIAVVLAAYARLSQNSPPSRTVSIAFDSDIPTLDPAVGYDSQSEAVERLIFDQLVTYDSGTHLVPLLARDMPNVSADGRTFTFQLREGAQFVRADGSPVRAVTAEDVAASFNRLLNPHLQPHQSLIPGTFVANIVGASDVKLGLAQQISGITVVDDHTVRFQLVRPDPSFLNILATPFFSVLPAEIAGTDTTAFSEAPVGSGPFVLQSRVAGQSLTFVRNQHYWQAGQPLVDGIDVRLNVDPAIALEQVEAGSLDLSGSSIPTGSYQTVISDARWASQVRTGQAVETHFLWMDTQSKSPLSNVFVRRAIEAAIDKDNILKITQGRGQVANCIFPPTLPGYDPTCDPYSHDVTKARALMAQAGAGPFSTKLYVTTEDPDPIIGQSIRQDLAAIGIDVQIVPLEFATFLHAIQVPDQAGLVYAGWNMDYPDPSNFIDPFLTCAMVIPAGSNYGRYCNPEVDTLADQARGEPDPQRRLALYQQIQDLIMKDAPVVPTRYPARVTLVSSRVASFQLHPVWIYDLRAVSLTP
jgi:oligopeptide transport system substrate-binding protein